MTFQARRYPKTGFHFRIADENYDFLYVLARHWDTSIAKALNRVIEEAKSGTTFCNPKMERTQ